MSPQTYYNPAVTFCPFHLDDVFVNPSANPTLLTLTTRGSDSGMDENAHSRVPPSASSRTRQSTPVSTVSSSARPHTQQHSLQLQQEEPQSQLNDYPHLAGSPNCLCAVCHLKDGVFPRRQDGKIVLPVPWPLPSLSEQRHSELGGRPRGLTTSTGLHVPGGVGTSSQAHRCRCRVSPYVSQPAAMLTRVRDL